LSTPTPRASPQVTLAKIRDLANFLPTWYPDEGWPTTAPLTVEERNLVSAALWREQDICWLRVLGTVLGTFCERFYLENAVLNHFSTFPDDVERMFVYSLASRHLRKHGKVLLQTYHSLKCGAYYPALCGVVPLAETVIKCEGYRNGFTADYKKFFEQYKDGVGVQTAQLYTEILYEKEPQGGIDNRHRFNRHKLMHGVSPDAVTFLDAIGGCLILDMVVSTVETNGHLLDRMLRQV